MGRTRNQRRGSSGANYLLFAAENILGWRCIRHVTGAQGEEMLARGAWRDVNDTFNNHIGYQVVASYRSDLEMLSGRPSAASITVNECKLNAGLGGRSRTAGMNEEQRIGRHTRFGAVLPPEDRIERAREKVREFGRNRLVAAPMAAE